jgi:hypothetical protein
MSLAQYELDGHVATITLNQPDVDVNAPGVEERIAADPPIQAELRRQKRRSRRCIERSTISWLWPRQVPPVVARCRKWTRPKR